MNESYPPLDAIVIGAGFAGLYMLHALQEHGFTCHGFETGDGVGGTWYWNRYPGARCDVESLDYCYSFSADLYSSWEWTERYATQPEILRYAEHVADELTLRHTITFGTTVVGAHFDNASNSWRIVTDSGAQFSSRFLITAVGCLSASQVPDLPGMESFRGSVMHTGRWPHDPVNLENLRIGVVGTGSSGIQLVPELAKVAAQLTVFQRTPNFSFPARNRPLNGRELWQAQAAYPAVTQQARTSGAGHYIRTTGKSATVVSDRERQTAYERAWDIGGTDLLALYNDTLRNMTSNGYLADFVRNKISALVVDPVVAAKLTPSDHPVGAKRPCVDTGYYETFNRQNVELVDLRTDPLVAAERQGLRTKTRFHELDAVVFATGYDAMTGPLIRLNIRDTAGVSLANRWQHGPAAYLGLAINGCPNMFTITGPGSPSVLVNVIRAIEQHVEWIMEILEDMRARDVNYVEADEESQDAWAREVDDMSYATVHRHANSWYLGSNIEGKARVFMPFLGGLAAYRSKCEAVREAGYEGFRFDKR